MNKVICIGRISSDLGLRYTPNNNPVCEFNIAVNRIGTEGTDFLTCVVWNKQAENLVKYQNAYTLASKMIQTLTEVYDRLILETGV